MTWNLCSKKSSSLFTRKFSDNHLLHFFIVLLVIILISVGLFCYLNLTLRETRNTNRLISAKLIVNALDNYQEKMDEYPEDLLKIEEFLSPLPVDPITNKLFKYQKKDNGYTLIIPQENKSDINFQKN